jgi:hypothetical protein
MLGMIHGEAGEGSFWSMAKYGQAHGDDAVCRNTILATLGEADDTMGMRLLNAKNNCKTTGKSVVFNMLHRDLVTSFELGCLYLAAFVNQVY